MLDGAHERAPPRRGVQPRARRRRRPRASPGPCARRGLGAAGDCRPRRAQPRRSPPPTLSAVSPPLRISGTFDPASAQQVPVEGLAGAAAQALRGRARRAGGSRCGSARASRRSPGSRTCTALITRRPSGARLGAVRRPLVAVQLEHASGRRASAAATTSSSGALTNTPHELDPAAQRGARSPARPPRRSSRAGCARRRSCRAPTRPARPRARRRRASVIPQIFTFGAQRRSPSVRRVRCARVTGCGRRRAGRCVERDRDACVFAVPVAQDSIVTVSPGFLAAIVAITSSIDSDRLAVDLRR